ncbi:hypothetical protein Taro_021616 [Colocasia esculenta]|uniref:Uncharacterized protein n=1 Tax=Colocasia esculenta TaxID=4460 RepID=A0A843VC17_COLES|nr:hypothetical protein [Colocasia esculenta]
MWPFISQKLCGFRSGNSSISSGPGFGNLPPTVSLDSYLLRRTGVTGTSIPKEDMVRSDSERKE